MEYPIRARVQLSLAEKNTIIFLLGFLSIEEGKKSETVKTVAVTIEIHPSS